MSMEIMTCDTYARAYCIIAGIDWDDVAGWRWDGDRIELEMKE